MELLIAPENKIAAVIGFLYLHLDGVVLSDADVKINTGKVFLGKKRQFKYTPNQPVLQ